MRKLNLIAVLALPSNQRSADTEPSLIASIYYKYDFNGSEEYLAKHLDVPLDPNSPLRRVSEIIRVRRRSIDRTSFLSYNKDSERFNGSLAEMPEEKFFNVLDLQFLKYREISELDFFTKPFFNTYLLPKGQSLMDTIFIFELLDWKGLVAYFKKIDVVLSGGSTVKRHALSPVQIKLANFVFLTEGVSNALKASRKSFEINNQRHKSNLIVNFSKNKNIWFIREKLRLSEISKELYWKASVYLYLLSKANPSYIEHLLETWESWEGSVSLYLQLEKDTITNPELSTINLQVLCESLFKWDSKYHPIEKRVKTLEELDIQFKAELSKPK